MKPAHLFAALSLVIAIVLPSIADQSKVKKPAEKPKPDPSLQPIVDEPGLPRVLLIGDSISIGYTLPTRELLKGKANVHRILTNGGPTTNGVANIDKWLGDGKWDVIHFNWGLHDLKIMPDTGKQQVSLADYESNLRKLVARMKATGARLIWCSTTPVPDGKLNPPRSNGDVLAYNAAAKKIMEEQGVAFDDLYAFTQPQLEKLQLPANVHFKPEGSQALAKQVAASIERALKK